MGWGAVVVMSVGLPWVVRCGVRAVGGVRCRRGWVVAVTAQTLVSMIEAALVVVGAGPQGLGAADDLHDLGGDGVLAGPVHDPRVLLDQLAGVLGGRGHGPLAGGDLGGRGLEQGGEDLGLGRPRGQVSRRMAASGSNSV